MFTLRRGVAVAAAVLLALSAAACESSDDSSSSGSSSDNAKIALLLPESQTTRYEQFDKPLFEAKVKSLCSDCTVVYNNANQQTDTQQQQAEAALNDGAKVLVLDPVDGEAAASIVTTAAAKKVPVISYDRLVTKADVDYYISFDNEKVGALQATSLVEKLKKDGKTSGNIVEINGSPTDNNAKLFNKGAESVLKTSGFTSQPSTAYFTPEWKPENAQTFMDGQISKLGKTGFVGVYAANDGTAGGAIAAMKAAGVSPIPPVTGQDAELAAIQRIVAGDQYMTIYKAIKPEAEKAAEIAVALAQGKEVTGADAKVNNGKKDVPSVLLTPVPVTKENIKTTVVADNFYTVAQICTADYQAACKTAGLQ
ncbi:sugar ABC transporter substrate-binding protein [Cryptosporangium phraense]|uniref:sugar ABC transporter substrate-binding protein n=1 Tax=Cryptosporangium phraense TaxID=2593070 RepID=UPI00147912C3|nr:sugar ABC transporter substrate-binding protein [Cryptosporangium phraense]